MQIPKSLGSQHPHLVASINPFFPLAIFNILYYPVPILQLNYAKRTVFEAAHALWEGAVGEKRGQARRGKSSTQETSKQEDFIRELTLLVRARYGMIWLQTSEEERMESHVKYLASAMNLPYFLWTRTRGLRNSDIDKPVYKSSDPRTALRHVAASQHPAIYYFQGLGPFLDDPVLSASLADVSRAFTRIAGALVLSGMEVKLPDLAKPHTAIVTPPIPDRRDYAALLGRILRDLDSRKPVKMELSAHDTSRLLNNLQGLTLLEAEKILTKAIIEDGRLGAEDIKRIIQAKKAVVEQDGLLEYFPVDEGMVAIADLKSLKSWLTKRKTIITDPSGAASFGLQFPKGILLLGVPGTGKSLCAKAVSVEWGLPLLKMDTSNLYNKYIGESEKNFKRAMVTAEKMAPVILWIDELEKAFATGGGEDGGVSQRVLGIFLSWMQERKGDVFVVATANDVGKLPPEFLRKGRFDEIFFLDLPQHNIREEIFQIHLKRRNHDTHNVDLASLAEATDGFSGAEIEQVIVAALYTAFADKRPLTMDLVVEEARKTIPLSRSRAEHIEALRTWAASRTVSAH